MPTRKQMDDAFPTVVRYTGVVLAIFIVVASFLGRASDVAGLGVIALGMILYKTVKGAVENGRNGNGNGKH